MTMRVRALLSLIAVLATMWLASCGHYICHTTFGNSSCTGGGVSLTQGNGNGIKVFAYRVVFSVNGQPSTGMSEQELDSGAGTFVDISTFTPPAKPPFPSGVVIVNKKFMYVPSNDGTLFGFTIDPVTGFLSLVSSVNAMPVAGGDSIAANPAGTALFVGDAAGQQISAFTINTDGSLTSAGTVATTGVSPAAMSTDGQGKFLFATAGAGQIAAFSISGGTLTPVPGNPFTTSSVLAIAGEPSGKFLLGISTTDNFIHVFSIGTSGAPTELSGAGFPVATQGTPVALAVDPNGKWVYTFDEDVVTAALEPIEGFQLDVTTGAMTELPGSPFSNLKANNGAIDQSGQFLLAQGITVVAGFSNDTVTPYGIDQTTGVLTSTIGSLGNAGNAAFAVTDEP